MTQSGTIASANPLRYSGYLYDGATGLYYLMARYYDPGVGRFMSRNTVQNGNLYTYCNNNPISATDPTGKITQADIDAYKSGKINKQQWDEINAISSYWSKAKTSGEKAFISAAASEYRNNGYKATVTIGTNGQAFRFKYWWGEKLYVDAKQSNKMAYNFNKQSIKAGSAFAVTGVIGGFIPEIGILVALPLGLTAAILQNAANDFAYGSSTGRGAVLVTRYYPLPWQSVSYSYLL